MNYGGFLATLMVEILQNKAANISILICITFNLLSGTVTLGLHDKKKKVINIEREHSTGRFASYQRQKQRYHITATS